LIYPALAGARAHSGAGGTGTGADLKICVFYVTYSKKALSLYIINYTIMVIVSSSELRNNMNRYLDLATTEPIVIQRGRTETFVLQTERHLAPDADLSRAITMDELLIGVKEDLRTMFKAGKK
jgi:hypothetical protein